MRVIGFNFTKTSVEKLNEEAADVKIKTSMDILGVKEIKSSLLKTKEEILEVEFEYIVDYTPGFAKAEIKGRLLLSADPKITKEILKQWKKKKMPPEVRANIMNVILRKSTLKALEMEDELNLPLHIPMPSFRRGSEQ